MDEDEFQRLLTAAMFEVRERLNRTEERVAFLEQQVAGGCGCPREIGDGE